MKHPSLLILLAPLGLLTACAPAPSEPAAATPKPAPATTPAPSSNPAIAPTTTNMNTPTASTTGSTPASTTAPIKTESAIFALGCFWSPELTFSKMPGVIDADVGYTGGRTTNPTYKEVCSDDTGHAEAVRIFFDPAKVTYQQLVDAFFANHDPTQVNRQGPDYGEQYRSAIFYQNDEQKTIAEATKAKLEASKKFSKPIATQIVKAGTYYKAEEYHQDYLKKRGLDTCAPGH